MDKHDYEALKYLTDLGQPQRVRLNIEHPHLIAGECFSGQLLTADPVGVVFQEEDNSRIFYPWHRIHHIQILN